MDLEKHRSRMISAEMYKWADLVIFMDGGNKRRLLQFVHAEELELTRSECLGRYAAPPGPRIPDPNFLPRGPEFDAVVGLILTASNNLAKEIKHGRGSKGKNSKSS